MEIFWGENAGLIWAFAAVVALVSGIVKGTVGFAMPTLFISGLGSILSPEIALAGLILPTLVTNVWQAFRQGVGAVRATVRRYRAFLISGLIVLVVSAQAVRQVPQGVLLLIIGFPITVYAFLGLMGRPIRLSSRPNRKTEMTAGAVAGFFGGISGVWGPATVAMLTAQGTEKSEQVRVQGVIYSLSALALFGAHLGSGVLRSETLPLSLILTVPAVIGMYLGFHVHDRIDQAMFRRITLVVLLIAGLNLVRRGILFA